MWKDKKYRRILLACIFASLAAVAGFFVLSRTYIKNLVYKERLNQMERLNDILRRMLEAASTRPRDRDELADRLRDGQDQQQKARPRKQTAAFQSHHQFHVFSSGGLPNPFFPL